MSKNKPQQEEIAASYEGNIAGYPNDILKLIPAPVAYLNQNSHYQYVNTAFAELLDLDVQTIMGKSILTTPGSDIFLQSSQHIDLVLSGKNTSFEYFIEGKTQLQKVEISLVPDFNNAQEVKGYMIYINSPANKSLSHNKSDGASQHEDAAADLSTPVNNSEDNSAAQDHALKTSDERYHRMVKEIQDYAVILLSTEGDIENWNKGAENIKGYKTEEIIGRNLRIFYTPEDQEKQLPQRLLKEAAENGRAQHEGWRVRKDGTRFWGSIVITALNDAENEVTGFSKVIRDLSEQKLAEDNLKQLTEELRQKNDYLKQGEQRYQRMIAEVQDYAILQLDNDGNIVNWNKGAEFIKGYSATEIVGQNFRIFYPPEDRENGLPESLLSLAKEKGKAIHEGWRVRKDGTRFWSSVVITAMHNDENEVIGFSKVTRDLTERKLAEEALKEKNRELEKRNEELSEFAYISSHDLQEPLRKIQTFITRILDSDADKFSDRSKDFFNRIQSAAARMRRLIEDLLSYSRTNTTDQIFVLTDLNKVLQDVKIELSEIIEDKKVIIESSPLPGLKVIPFQFHQLLMNIVNNAIKFAKKDIAPYISITADVVKGSEIESSMAKDATLYHRLTFTDNGIGFDPEFNKAVFEVFQRLHGRSEFEGTGIGLAICKKIVENHDGIITAEGRINDGATFRIFLPLQDDPAVSAKRVD
jgi:PAS domain S-box-containing protein